ncbi:MAG: type II toxin-antitoxin system Phd/YefM family antitoxin [Trueperaceae bacterium]|nr:MAG: type II toxin-antitoxin system Phd/YefM family antitoxin [Trueperaceae bacterium]
MPKTVSKSQFKPRALAYLREVEETGEALVLTNRGRPVLRITPYAPADETLAALTGCVVRFEDATDPVASDEWEAG